MSTTAHHPRAHAANGKIDQIRASVSTALDNGRESLDRLRAEAARRARQADGLVRDNPYYAIGIAAGVGAIIGILAARRFSR